MIQMTAWISVKCWKGPDRPCQFHVYSKERMGECLIIEFGSSSIHNAPKRLKFSVEPSIVFI